MDTVVKRKNWFKRLFILDYDVQLAPLLESIDPILENIQIQQIEIDGLSEAMKVVVRQVESVEEKLNLIKTFDYQGRILYAQADLDMNASGNSSIAVSIDNVNKAAYLRFGSSEAVDTVDAVWFISKTGNKVRNDFGDELSSSAPRLTVQDFLRMTQEKQGDATLEDLVPPHTHDVYQDEIEALDTRVENLESSASGDAFDDSELKKGIAENSAEIAVNTAGIESNSAAIGANYVRCEENELKTIENAFQIALVDVRVDDIEEFLGGVYFEVSLGIDRWTFDTGSVPGEGNFTAFSYDFSATNTEYWINEFAAGQAVNNWVDARPGDKFNVTAQNNGDTNYGKYVISTIEKSDGIWNITGDFVEGEGRLTAGAGYFIEILHGSRQFETSVGGENHSEEISNLTDRVNDNSANIRELRKNDEFILNQLHYHDMPSATFDYANTRTVSGSPRWETDPTSTFYLYHYTAITNTGPTGGFCDWAGLTSTGRDFVFRSQEWVDNPDGPEIGNAGLVKIFDQVSPQAAGKVCLPKSMFSGAGGWQREELEAIVGTGIKSAYKIKGTSEWLCNLDNDGSDPRVQYVHAPSLDSSSYSEDESPAFFDQKVWEEWLEEQKTLTDTKPNE